ncbi:MAG: hypothetical protein U9Q18_02505 [Caldisericota bacterium]|nr:hypothetical protein [Caldisericota bacterium]
MNADRDAPATKEGLDQVERKLTARIDGVEQSLTVKIDANGKKIDANAAKIDANGKKIDANAAKIDANAAKIDANGKKIDANGKKIDANSATLSRVSHQVVENSEQIGRLVIMAEESRESLNQILGALDGFASGFAQLDQEKVATNARFDRVEKDVQQLKAR